MRAIDSRSLGGLCIILGVAGVDMLPSSLSFSPRHPLASGLTVCSIPFGVSCESVGRGQTVVLVAAVVGFNSVEVQCAGP